MEFFFPNMIEKETRMTPSPTIAPTSSPSPDDKCANIDGPGTFFTCLGLSWAGMIKAIQDKRPFDKVMTDNMRVMYMVIDVAAVVIVLVIIGWLMSSGSRDDDDGRHENHHHHHHHDDDD